MEYDEIHEYDRLMAQINSQIEALHAYSTKLKDLYWENWNKRTELYGRGSLGVRVMFQKTSQNLTIIWYRRQLMRFGETFRINNKYLKKNVNVFEYPEEKVTTFAKEWEIDLFRQIEPEFSKIRRRAKQLGKIRLHFKQLHKVATQYQFEHDLSLEKEGAYA